MEMIFARAFKWREVNGQRSLIIILCVAALREFPIALYTSPQFFVQCYSLFVSATPSVFHRSKVCACSPQKSNQLIFSSPHALKLLRRFQSREIPKRKTSIERFRILFEHICCWPRGTQ